MAEKLTGPDAWPSTVQKATDAIVDFATRGGRAPTGRFIDRSGVAPF